MDIKKMADITAEVLKSQIVKFKGEFFEKIAFLEKKIEDLPSPKDGVDGKDGKDGADGKDGLNGLDGKSVDIQEVLAAVKPEIEEIAKSVKDGIDGKDGVNGIDGTSVAIEDVIPVIKAEVQEIVKTIKDGKDGVNGKDGTDGKSVDINDVIPVIRTEVEAVTKNLKDGRDGRDGLDGKNGQDAFDLEILPIIDKERSYPRGIYAKHNGGLWKSFESTDGMKGWECIVDGIGEIEVDYDGERAFAIKMVKSSGVLVSKEFTVPMVIDRGVFKNGTEYKRFDGVTFGGSFWIAQKDAPEGKPGGGAEDWRLSVKRGRNASDPVGTKK